MLRFNLTFQSFNIQFDRNPFDVFMLFNCYFAKGRTKNRDIDFLKLSSLGFQRSCIKTEVLCCT